MNDTNIAQNIPNTLNLRDLSMFQPIANMMQTGVILVDFNQKDMPIVFVNDFFVQMTGYEKEEVIGKNARFLQGTYLDQTPKNKLKKALQKHEACEIELKNFKKDGTPFYNLLKITPLFDDEQNLLYYMGTQVDITNSLEYRRISTIKRLAEGLTHEINTAMTPIQGNIQMLKYDIEAISDETAKQYMLESLQSILQSKKIIEDISNSLHYYCSENKGSVEKVSISDTIQIAIKGYEKRIKIHTININLDLENDLQVYAEKEAMIHLWMILLDNSIDALNEHETFKNISIKTQKDSSEIQIIFEDNANGIDPNIQEDIFKALTKNKEYGGIGIGLYVAKVIVENNDGTISFNTSKEGTKFTITLPFV